MNGKRRSRAPGLLSSSVTRRVSHPFNNISFSAREPLDPAYPAVISTIGDHLRTRRLNWGLVQKDVAEHLGVTTDTITNWELNRSEPKIGYLPLLKLPFIPVLRFNGARE